ncbi:rod shape-determining protein MreC [Solemya velesiana gill symbiont]|uniref:rod shape-determining protein MreC n=1 Tax=Solemya velesiana gill symbiont TaxID=1918948 RepID=UPI002481A71F|nr:rod shape-determining protein MreC [Solemya velesiana gill symbiont]
MFTQGPSVTTRVVIAVMVSLALMVVDHRYHHLETVRSALSVATYPLHFIADLPVSATNWVTEVFATRNHLESENQRLHKENLHFRARQQKFAALEEENMRLRNLLESSFKVGERILIAELIAVDLDPYRQQVLINKGNTSGAYKGQPVLDADAVMGQVVHVNRYNSTVLMITDASHALPVQVNRNGLRTIAMGTGRINELELPHLPNNADIEVGDLLVTSGLGGRFPPGYPVAEVVSVEREPQQPFAVIKAQPSAHLDRTREALLVWTLTPPEARSEIANANPDDPDTTQGAEQ